MGQSGQSLTVGQREEPSSERRQESCTRKIKERKEKYGSEGIQGDSC
jgi:hypothetical protein